MLKTIFYKEWLKVKWLYSAMALLSFLTITYIFFQLRLEIRLIDNISYWYRIIFYGQMFYLPYKYIPSIIGLVIGLGQFIPEIQENRLKLTLHLPIEEKRHLLSLVLCGSGILVLLYIVSSLLLIMVSALNFPVEITSTVFFTTLPWFIAGLAIYFAIPLIIIDTNWIRRAIYVILLAGFIDLFFYSPSYSLYIHSSYKFLILTFLLSISILFSGYRFKRGARS